MTGGGQSLATGVFRSKALDDVLESSGNRSGKLLQKFDDNRD
jgi:hypothetical protein